MLLTSVRDLVRIGSRMGGTASGDKAAKYVSRKLKSYGLKVETIEDPERLTFANQKWSLAIEEPKSLRRLVKNEWLGGFSPTVPKTKSKVVYVSDPGTLEKEQIENKAVLLDQPFSQKSYQKMVESGATAILLTSPKLPGAYSQWAFISDLQESENNKIPLFNLSYGNGNRLKKELADSVSVVVSFSTQTSIDRGSPKTVVATMKGESNEYYLVCAHGDSDSGGPGADDNASGVAGVLEIARVLNGLVQSKALPKPKKSIKFIIWSDEIYSSESYVKRNAKELDRILAVLNFDEIGTGASRNCLYFESNDIAHNEKLLTLFQKVGEEFAGRKGFWQEATTNPSQGGTDSYMFLPEYLKRLKLPDVKIPSVTIYTAAWNEPKNLRQTPGWASSAWKGNPDSVIVDYSAYYHSSLDIPELTTEKEPFNMSGAVKAVGIVLLHLAWEK